MRQSQFGEDAHIAAILDEIGDGSKVLCDIGARLRYSNSVALLTERGYSGVLIDADRGACEDLEAQRLKADVICAKVTPDNVNALVPGHARFLSIDIDSADFWVWAALLARPPLVVVETNPLEGFYVACPPHYDRENYGMSVEAAVWLGERKGYTYVGRTDVNCFFVRRDLNCSYRLASPQTHGGVPCGTGRNAFA